MECVLLLFCLKVLYPNKLFLLRGNHEWLQTSKGYTESFERHITNLYKNLDDVQTLVYAFMSAFSYMSLACLLSQQRILCVHGGIPRAFRRSLLSLTEYLEKYVKKPIEGSFPKRVGNNVVTDLMWGDPVEDESTAQTTRELPEGFYRSPRDLDGTVTACTFGKKALENFLKGHRLQMLIRAHQNQDMGCFVSNSSQLVTVFSSSRYSKGNRGAALYLDDSVLTVLAHEPEVVDTKDKPVTSTPPPPADEHEGDTDEDE